MAEGRGSQMWWCVLGLYTQRSGVEIDTKKAKHYFELAAMKGEVEARHNLGNNEYIPSQSIQKFHDCGKGLDTIILLTWLSKCSGLV